MRKKGRNSIDWIPRLSANLANLWAPNLQHSSKRRMHFTNLHRTIWKKQVSQANLWSSQDYSLPPSPTKNNIWSTSGRSSRQTSSMAWDSSSVCNKNMMKNHRKKLFWESHRFLTKILKKEAKTTSNDRYTYIWSQNTPSKCKTFQLMKTNLNLICFPTDLILTFTVL